ncbi:OsmC-like protein [Candidatus Zinderia insecticola CARI]|uniref:OsmC-like protein n=1 Tax=Zinderia insecticola (strain CARI) TaxID=871271 RepID=E0TIQ7_ZINIC|nr:OsmC-like protein [Candidatus Zinderia insecticola CARI]
MKCIIKWNKILNTTLIGITDSKNIITMNSNKNEYSSPRPMEIILLGAGGCTTYDIITILKKNNQNIISLKLLINSKRSKKIPKVFININFFFKIYGININKNLIESAINVSHKKYCSAIIMLNKTAKISHNFKIKRIKY